MKLEFGGFYKVKETGIIIEIVAGCWDDGNLYIGEEFDEDLGQGVNNLDYYESHELEEHGWI